MTNYNININTPLIIDVNQLLNGIDSGYWSVNGTKIKHNSSVESYIDKQYPFLEVGKYYTIEYSVNIVSCNCRVYLGDTTGTMRSVTSGIQTFSELLLFTGSNKRLRFWSNGECEISNLKIRESKVVVTDVPLDLKDGDYLENKSFTLSYYPQAKQWVSFHSYLPNNYIIHPNSLLVKSNDSQIMKVNSGDYGKYFDNVIKKFILEVVFNEGPIVTKVFDNITVNLKSEFDNRNTNKFFDEIILYTEYQCSGVIELNTTNLTKKERDWTINKFNDLTNNAQEAMFTSDWEAVKSEYPIDKVVNDNKINYNKPWYQRGRFRDKFLKVRFIENNLDNNKIIVNFVSTIFRGSER